MPLPSPRTGEKKDDFIERCMGDDTMVEEYPDDAQRRAVCETQWDDKDGNAMKKFEIKAKNKIAEIWIYDDIGDLWWGGVTAKAFADELKAAGSVETIKIYLNSAGGLVSDGLAIYNTLKRHAARKEVYIDGFALSTASLVAMAGDSIYMAANGMMMVHKPWGFAEGNAEDMRKKAETLDKLELQLVDTYVRRTGQSEAEISVLVANETWMTAEDALALGFVDEITDEQKLAAYVGPDQLKKRFNKVPAELIEKLPAPSSTEQPEQHKIRSKYSDEVAGLKAIADQYRL